jgi:hypothetical protein
MELPPPRFCVFFFNACYCACPESSMCMHNPARVCWTPVALRPAPIPPLFPPSGPLGVSPDPPLCPPVLVVFLFLCPPVLLVSLLIPPRVLRCPWCLLDPTVAQHSIWVPRQSTALQYARTALQYASALWEFGPPCSKPTLVGASPPPGGVLGTCYTVWFMSIGAFLANWRSVSSATSGFWFI